jgi:hypothetical protein
MRKSMIKDETAGIVSNSPLRYHEPAGSRSRNMNVTGDQKGH